MKSDYPQLLLVLFLSAVWVLILPCRAQEKPPCEVAIAALTLPNGSSGLLHVRTEPVATTPLQLSTRYFSERVKLPGSTLQFFKEPVVIKEASAAPEPLLTLQLPPATKLAYAVLWAETDQKKQTVWKGYIITAKDWENSSLKVFNASSEQIGITAGTKNILLLSGKSVDFPARDWGKPFPVKLFHFKPETKCIFSSTWRVTSGSRELCFVCNINHAVSLRSIMEISSPKSKAVP